MRDIFRHDGISSWKIFTNIVRLVCSQLLNRRLVERPVNSYRMLLDLKTPGLSKALFIYGSREVLDTKLVKQAAAEGANFLEVGANIGYYALLEATNLTEGKVIAFEPDPRNVELLKKNIELNDVDDKVKVYPYAASDESATLPLHLNERTNVSNFVHKDNSIDTINVKSVRLDDFPQIDEIDFVRMDVEGYECKVLRGLEKVIQDKSRPLKIMIEAHPGKYNESDLNFKEELQKLFDASFQTEYIISAGESQRPFSSRGYKPIDKGVETETVRYLYKDISPEDTLDILDDRAIRSILLQRK